MSDLYEIEFTPSAESQIDDIVFYLENNESESVADKVKRGIFDAVEGLIEMPHRHGIFRGVSDAEFTFRRVLKWSYIIVFYINEGNQTITIVDVSHSRQDPQKLIDRLSE